MFNCLLSLFVSVQFSDAYVNVLSVIVFFSLDLTWLALRLQGYHPTAPRP